MADKLIAKSPAGDRLFQQGAHVDPMLKDAPWMSLRGYGIRGEEMPVVAFGYVQYADGRSFPVDDVLAFLGRGFFEQVADVDLTVEG